MIVQCDKSLHSKTIHPLINIGCLSDISNTFIETGFYRIILKDRSSCPDFGRLCCDYQDASVIFLSPEYSLSCLTSEDLSFYKKSIFLSFHADLINTSVEHYARVAGYGFLAGQGTSYGMAIIRLKNWDERKGAEHVSDAVVARLNAQFAQIKEAQIFCFQPGMIPGYGLGNSIELNLQDRTGGDMSTFYGNAMQYIGALNQRPEVAMAYTSY